MIGPIQTALIEQFGKQLSEEAVLGPFSKTSDPAIVEMMGLAGFDFVILDMEHGPASMLTVQSLIRAAELRSVLPIVRTAEGADWQIGAVLDSGAGGVQIPHVSTAAQAATMVDHARFAPEGMRGVCRYVRAADYSSQDKFDYLKAANRALLIVQVEGSEGLANLGRIAAVFSAACRQAVSAFAKKDR
jgi:4-hydroxy-2-oxoheptanedioate aldolase